MFKQMIAALRPLTWGAALVSVLLLSVPTEAGTIAGQCSDCHTMHNSEQSAPVASRGLNGTVSATPLPNLLRYDCIACHARDSEGPKITTLGSGSQIPQVYHGGANDLAAGNFRYITAGGNRKGHNVSDLFSGGDDTANNYTRPPGYHPGPDNGAHNQVFADGANPFGKFTCAGAAGCHGTRSQLLSGTNEGSWVRRTGIAAISGAHHANYDGRKSPLQNSRNVHDGAHVAASYRFLAGLKGYGNESNRWQNVDASSHNEYFGAAIDFFPDTEGHTMVCNRCHIPAGAGDGPNPQMQATSTLKVPNQSMSGFCATCHSSFHSSGSENGVSGAFLRHPSDFVIPSRGEYAAYTTYAVSAPVARPTLYTTASSQVTPGTDLVMCLSCHQAHATPYDGMLRFDYAAMVVGGHTTNPGVGCLACHTFKGVADGG